MKTRPPWFNTLSAALLLLLAAAWAMFAPIQFGGQTAYVIVAGTSMEPNFHRGDLAILRQAEEYAVGDVVTYRHPTIGPVIHRVIGRDGDRFIFKGDNNSWIDEHRPTQDELIGKLWIYLPGAGKVLEQLRTPGHMATLVAVMGAIVMTTRTSTARSGRRPRSPRSLPLTIRLVLGGRAETRSKPPSAITRLGAAGEDWLFALGTLAFAALVLGLFAFTRPTTRITSENIGYEQTATWSYSAVAPPGVYDTAAAQTGEPVFRRLTNNVTVRFAYQITSDQPIDVGGTYRLVAEIGDTSGWKRAIELQPDTTFRDRSFTADGTLDLAHVEALIDSFERQTGEQRPQYNLAIVPDVRVQGALAGQPLSDSFAPRLEFQIDRQELRFLKDATNALDPLQPMKKGMLKQDRVTPNTLPLLGLTLNVVTARWLAIIGLALALSIGAAARALPHPSGALDEAAQIQRKYSPLLIAVRETIVETSEQMIDVATIDDLARLAERGGHMILHQPADDADYLVRDGGLTYRYRPANPRRMAAVPPQEQAS